MRPELGPGRPHRAAVTNRVRCGPVQPGGIAHGLAHGLAHCPGTDNEGGVLQGELPVALAE
jgi:hypothetical protein